MRIKAFLSLLGLLTAWTGLSAEGIPEMFEARARTLVFVEYYTQREIDRQTGEGIGLLVSDEGHVVCLP
ncbi:MAG TPA: hypothetical protein VK995_05930, partial [Oceanipulchritudo sp.]|nr:hypothetical protein [Oceanipulchritudo sp.]